jgi:hypothetical protein
MQTDGQQATTLGPSIYHTVPSLTAPRGSTDDVLRRSDEDQHLGGLTNRFLACSIDGRRLGLVLPSFRRGRSRIQAPNLWMVYRELRVLGRKGAVLFSCTVA